MRSDKLRNRYKRITKRKVTYRDLEKKLDRIFSEYIRLRDADDKGWCQCITCGNWHYWKDLHCGHYISRAVKAVRFNEMNCHSQCVRCNSFRQGQPHLYRFALIDLYGKEAVEELELKARLGGSENRDSLEIMIEEYKEKVKVLKSEKGL